MLSRNFINSIQNGINFTFACGYFHHSSPDKTYNKDQIIQQFFFKSALQWSDYFIHSFIYIFTLGLNTQRRILGLFVGGANDPFSQRNIWTCKLACCSLFFFSQVLQNGVLFSECLSLSKNNELMFGHADSSDANPRTSH